VDTETPVPPPVEPPRGKFNGRLDDKGRLKLPVQLQEYLTGFPEKKLFVTSLDRRTARIYPIAAWRKMEALLLNSTENTDECERLNFNAQDLGAEAEVDGQGRLLLHPELRRELGMEESGLRLLSNRGHIMVMTEARYEARKAAASRDPESDVSALEKKGLI
jgi:MraZ protein